MSPPQKTHSWMLAACVVMAGAGCRGCLPSDTDSTPAGVRLTRSADAPFEPLCPGDPERCRLVGPAELALETPEGCRARLTLQRREANDPNPSVGLLEREPGLESPDARFMLVVRTGRGWFEMPDALGIGRTARQGSSYVRWLGADYGTYVSRRDGHTEAAWLAVYERGQSVPYGCELEASAEVRGRLCALADGQPLCVADVALARVPYREDNLLPTVDEALGQCDAAGAPTEAADPGALARDVSVVTHDRLVVREGHERRVFALGAVLCELSHAPELCPAEAGAGAGAETGASAFARETILSHSFY